MVQHFKDCPIPENQILSNLGLFLGSKNLARILFMNHIYSQIVDVPGIVIEFGTRWGQNAALFTALRGIYEPFNRTRKIVAFDTFSGFTSLNEKDGNSAMMEIGALTTTNGYEEYLSNQLNFIEQENPLSHITKYEIRKGDATREIGDYLEENQETIVSLAYFDFDVYEPTLKCLKKIKDRIVKGSILAFDELNDHNCPGETLALMEVFGLSRIKLKRWPYASRVSYFIYE